MFSLGRKEGGAVNRGTHSNTCVCEWGRRRGGRVGRGDGEKVVIGRHFFGKERVVGVAGGGKHVAVVCHSGLF